MEFLLVIQSALLWLAVVLFYKCCLPLILALYYGHSLFPNIILFHELFLLHQAAACCFIMDWRCKHFISQNVKVLNIIIKRKSWHWWYEYSVVYQFPPKPCLILNQKSFSHNIFQSNGFDMKYFHPQIFSLFNNHLQPHSSLLYKYVLSIHQWEVDLKGKSTLRVGKLGRCSMRQYKLCELRDNWQLTLNTGTKRICI